VDGLVIVNVANPSLIRGAPLGRGACVDKKGAVKALTQVMRYSIVQAKDLDAAKAMIVDHPHLMMPKAIIEVAPAFWK
jgi:hypothetical protein